jgi:hypothetical protein
MIAAAALVASPSNWFSTGSNSTDKGFEWVMAAGDLFRFKRIEWDFQTIIGGRHLLVADP